MKKKIDFSIIPQRGNQVESGKKVASFWRKNIKKIKKFKKDKYFLHDGPPFVNGELHAGHLVNKTLKSLVLFSRNFLGYDVSTKLGFDCNGLPILLKVMEQIPEEKKNNIDFLLKACNEYQTKWINIQKKQIEELFLFEEDVYYETRKEFPKIYKNFSQLLLKNLLEIKNKPVYWSMSDQTVLAESEIEYKEKKTQSVYFPFKVKDNDFYILIWTTTPWTLMGNKAIGYNKNIKYHLVEIDNKKYLVSKNSKLPFKITETIEIDLDISKLKYEHFASKEINSMLECDFVVEEATGLVHLAPAHGLDDFYVCEKNKINSVDYIDNNGYFKETSFKGLHIFKDEKIILEKLNPLKIIEIKHTYPFSSRSKNCPIIFKLTEQIFINIESIKNNVEKIIKSFDIYPKDDRFLNILKSRTEWCVSRQRLLGVPLALFIEKKTRKLLINEKLQEKIEIQMKKDYKFFLKKSSINILKGIVNPKDYEAFLGTIDVWFDSGSSFSYVKEVADLYCEGVDQFRGWYQSSLILSILLKGKVPYKKLLSHGFVVDGNKEKMSKSVGNVISWNEIVNWGLESFRLLICKSDIYSSIKVSKDLIDQSGSYFRKIRDVLRFLATITLHSKVKQVRKLDSLDKAFISKLKKTSLELKQQLEIFNFNKSFDILIDFIDEVSEVYINAQKNFIYEKNSSLEYTVKILTKGLLIMSASFLPVACEDIYQQIKKKIGNKVSILCYDFSFFDELNFFEKEEKMVNKILKKLKEIGGERESFKEKNNLKQLNQVSITITKDFDKKLFTILSKTKIKIGKKFSFNII